MKRIQRKHPLATRWFHWANAPVLVVMIWSGLLIYWANDVYRVGLGSVTLFRFFPSSFYNTFEMSHRLAEGMAWHFAFMWLFVLNGLLYVLFTVWSGEWRALLPNRRSVRGAIDEMLYDLHLAGRPAAPGKYNGAQRIAYTGVIAMGAGSLLTGLAIYKPVQCSLLVCVLGGYQFAREIHFWLTLGYCAFIVIHVCKVITAGWGNFRSMVTGAEIVSVEEGR